MKTKEQILEEHCKDHHTHIDIENDVIDGRTYSVLEAMEEYANQFIDKATILRIMFDTHEKYSPHDPLTHETSELYLYMAHRITSQNLK